ncbi:HAD-IIIC family phosphatase [Pseudokordiimonas caeni]|uniref:HAD-IIIC family phosphatase n=1 Tax=Pseudokordiimonas caeni TaxID=2997908 RepID=UPI0028122EDF|nr:HAD-IIIC family phosphatase [Pseudokordiimonas caeni]
MAMLIESESGNVKRTAWPDSLGADALAGLVQPADIVGRSLLSWSEHCSECTMPACFTSCQFYAPRRDFKCARFRRGFEIASGPEGAKMARVAYGKWAKLEAIGSHALRGGLATRLALGLSSAVGGLIWRLPVPHGGRTWAARKFYGLKAKLARRSGGVPVTASHAFLLQAASLSGKPSSLILEFRNKDGRTGVFQKNVTIEAGLTSIAIDIASISALIDLSGDYFVAVYPAQEGGNIDIAFLFADFVQLRDPQKFLSAAAKPAAKKEAKKTPADKVKCIIWDLDNTLWKGVLIEDGADKLVARTELIDFIKAMDARGILHSVASKNNEADGLAKLRELGIEEYFLYPQINWGPKSQSIDIIRQSLNIGIDTFAFIDDQPFEREEVAAIHPAVRTFDALDFESWRDHPSFDVEVTDESAGRRQMYRDEMSRNSFLATNGEADFLAFLRGCNLQVEMEPLSEDRLPRAHELAQRTNQMNFSGCRYTKAQLAEIAASDNKLAMLVHASDRFGNYGIVGLAIFDRPAGLLEDLMFSCRIQGKYVDHAVIQHFLENQGADMKIRFKPSDRNIKPAEIFSKLGFEEVDMDGDFKILQRPAGKPFDHQDIVNVKVIDHVVS